MTKQGEKLMGFFVCFGFFMPSSCILASYILHYFLTENFFYRGGNSISMILRMTFSSTSVVKICFSNPLFSSVIKLILLSNPRIILYRKLNPMSSNRLEEKACPIWSRFCISNSKWHFLALLLRVPPGNAAQHLLTEVWWVSCRVSGAD